VINSDGSGRLVIFTDGACQGNPGPGGWAWAVSPSGSPSGSGGDVQTTNQRMEVFAVLDALRTYAALADEHGAPMPIEIVSDSTYVVNCFRDRWWAKWERNGWKNSKREPVANTDLWMPLIELVKSLDVTFRWVKGHSGDKMNDLVDQLAVSAVPRR
jgi:ribonuclease HI